MLTSGRVYDPMVARFLSADPILQDPQNGQSYNRFSYVLNNPTNFTDPTGFETVTGPACKGVKQGCVIAYEAEKLKADKPESGDSSTRSADTGGKRTPGKMGTNTVPLGNGVQLVPREGWARYPADPEKMTESGGDYSIITLHHTGSKDTPESVEELHRNKISALEKFERKVGGAQSYDGQGDVSYHFLIDKDGKIYAARSLDFKGAHVFGFNNKNIGIAFLGDYSNSPLTSNQVNASIVLIDRLNTQYGNHSQNALYGSLTIYSHGNFDMKKRDELGGAQSQIQTIKETTSQHWEQH